LATVTIRAMEARDISRVFEIDTLSSSLPWTERSYAFEYSHNPGTRIWLAEIPDEHDAGVVAFLVIWLILDEVHIANLAVHPEYRRRHVGQELLQHGLSKGWCEGGRVAFLEVRQSNTYAQALYHQFGFVEVGVRRHYYHDTQEDAILMTLEQPAFEQLFGTHNNQETGSWQEV